VANIRLTEDEAWTMLEEQRVGILTSIRRDGTPISLPLWYVPMDRRIYLRGPVASKKIARVRNNPRVAFLCETGKRWVDLRAVHMTGEARCVDDETLIAIVAREFDRRYADLRPPRRGLPNSAISHYRNFAVIEIVPDSRFLSWDNHRLVMH
jgi:nitroimidazol reductase NimA-like FMN-containing flavoprotein (pyridoxamine 5'-phosphate oxidase superfamily)